MTRIMKIAHAATALSLAAEGTRLQDKLLVLYALRDSDRVGRLIAETKEQLRKVDVALAIVRAGSRIDERPGWRAVS